MFSNTSKQRLATAIAGAALASAMAVSSASADLHAIDEYHRAAVEAQTADTYQDLRSPDAVDAARAAGDPPRVDVAPPPSSIAATSGDTYQDLRSPDTRDYANDYAPTLEPQPVADTPSAPSGFDFVSAAIGAVIAGGLSLLLMGTLGMRRQPGGRTASA